MKEILSLIDREWIIQNPDTVLELIECLWHELKQRKDYIETLHQKLLLGASIIEGLKGEQE